jgi:hypothetical protein
MASTVAPAATEPPSSIKDLADAAAHLRGDLGPLLREQLSRGLDAIGEIDGPDGREGHGPPGGGLLLLLAAAGGEQEEEGKGQRAKAAAHGEGLRPWPAAAAPAAGETNPHSIASREVSSSELDQPSRGRLICIEIRP